jgi:hypothetical protein
MKRISLLALAAMGVFVAMPASADKWDQANCPPPSSGCNDSCATCGTNELVHGTSQVHDVDDALSGLTDDEDWYFLSLKPNTSYEVVVDGTTPYMNRTTPVSLTLVQADGTLDTSDYAVSSRGFSRSLRVGNSTTTVNDDRWVRVTAATDCAGGCFDIDEYHISMRETTYYIPRFNNSSTQVSVLILQNPRDAGVSGNLYFWDTAGTLLNTTPVSLAAKSTAVINTSAIVPGASGSVTLSHNSTYGSLSGKMVALEPATGFTFDTIMVPRVN